MILQHPAQFFRRIIAGQKKTAACTQLFRQLHDSLDNAVHTLQPEVAAHQEQHQLIIA